MRLHIAAVGRLRGGAERTLVDDYLGRLDRTGRGLGLSLGEMVEVEDRKGGGAAAEARLLRSAAPDGATVWVLDERGRTLSSPDFATAIAARRDEGGKDLVFMIGGADGLDPSLRDDADMAISFGAMVWPHMLARVMLAEQLYRAATILAGSPYHRT
ncbi:23S rRNA (pseudouridine(1915)-N(3))-methyltransferase RlmH [Roseibacterium sp. SDUM158017]|uniref:23S rRNA (pseudouridine(1915)-N(3))-methyltransferase RlmH n=1 Tax=Roseicyclus salinarum TaxID=3036773 RepID=UPI0024154E44|nr:23S rRNA (pseudouridine(1915)-N(3))-methyltransferase RlmH [Roseibacterium sp. SDUM158017]MDG4647056.1 23S rRNA (pseudouridine(1915)-N(3))-methyltransferase RlmH [Roseibacterium sp. SDUM158017]